MTTHRSAGTFVYLASAVLALMSFSLRTFGADAARSIRSLPVAGRANLPNNTGVALPEKRFAHRQSQPTSLTGAATNAQSPPGNPQSPQGNKGVSNGVLQIQGSSAPGQGGGNQNAPAPCGVTNTNASPAGPPLKQSGGTGGGIQNNPATNAVAATKQSGWTGASGLGGSPSDGRGLVIQGNGQTVIGNGVQIQSNGALQPGRGNGKGGFTGVRKKPGTEIAADKEVVVGFVDGDPDKPLKIKAENSATKIVAPPTPTPRSRR